MIHWAAISRGNTPPAAIGARPASECQPASPNSPRVLVADDDPTNQLVLRAILERDGCDVTVVEDGERALHALMTQPFDVAVVDVRMPALDGLDVVARYQSSVRSDDRARCILLTASAPDRPDERLEVLALTACLSKPIQPEELLRAVHRGVAKSESSPAIEPGVTP